MAQYNLFNSDDVRVGLLLFFRIWSEHGAIPLLIKGGHETIFSFYHNVFMRVLC